MQTPNPTVASIDARPIRATSTDTPWDRAVKLRYSLVSQMRATLEEIGFEALLFVSSNGNYPPWAKLEAWLPRPSGPDRGGRERVELVLVVDVKPYNKSELVVSAYATRGARKLSVTNRPDFSERDVRDWTLYTLRRAGKPRNYSPVLDALHGLVATVLPFLPGPHANPVQAQYRNRFRVSRAGALGLLSLIVLVGSIAALSAPDIADDAPWMAILPWLGVAGLIVTFFLVRRRRHAVHVTDQPTVPPRNPGMVDSWHAVVAEIGRDFAAARDRLVATLKAEEGVAGLTCQMETYGYRTPNGYEERERLVVSKGQCFVHVHIYPFSDDLFVGWDAYLNWAKWDETAPVSRKAQSGMTIEFRELRQGFYVPNQFDLIDLNSLSELVHRRLEREIKAMIKERGIDQDIDFRIIRGDRDVALDQSRRGQGASGKSKPAWQYVAGEPA
jgi:hypothetical protein